MAQRRKIGIYYVYTEEWIGGVYYIFNLIKALNRLPDTKKPFLTVFSPTIREFQVLQKETGYPYLIYNSIHSNYNFAERLINKLWRTLFKNNLIEKRPVDSSIDLFFPGRFHYEFELITNKLFWLADFQEFHFPHFFTESEIVNRENTYHQILKSKKPIVFSSKMAKNDFGSAFPDNQNKTFVLNFSSINNPHLMPDSNTVKSKYALAKKFFLVSNQFWKHKNHILVLKALKDLINRSVNEINFQIVFTGKETDTRDPDFFSSIRLFVETFKLTDYVKFIGFIDRNEQLSLMNNCISVIQPSLFEGWSSVVEDAKSLGKFIIISDTPVHREQATDNMCFFNPHDELQLSKLLDFYSKNIPPNIKSNYDTFILDFAANFMNIVDYICEDKNV
jgi:glycosyltransferase involved in cell wall biosynthesis